MCCNIFENFWETMFFLLKIDNKIIKTNSCREKELEPSRGSFEARIGIPQVCVLCGSLSM